MRALQDLARFIRAKDTQEERHEIREYAGANAAALAAAFDVEAPVLRARMNNIEADARLAASLLAQIKSANATVRSRKAAQRSIGAQASADILGRAAEWNGDRANVDVVSLFAASLTTPAGMLVFTCEAFAVSIPMAPLFDVRRLERVDLTGFVDPGGLHIRWASGGLNFRSRLDPRAAAIIVHLPPRSKALAA